MLELSQHSIIGKIKDSDKCFIINPLSRQADIISLNSAESLQNGAFTTDEINESELFEKGYICDPKDEKRRFRKAYLDFIDNREKDEIQLFYVPTYACNFGCSYCYQEGYEPVNAGEGMIAVEAFFSYIDEFFANRRKYITIFGGEPLLVGDSHKMVIQAIIHEATKRDLTVAIVTNGYELESYIPVLQEGIIREVQVTLDGPKDVHNARRPLKGGGPTFDKIVSGIDACLEAKLPVNLRAVIDKENVNSLPELARFAVDKGWTSNPFFKTQLGRNYELHYCQANSGKLFDRLEMYETIYELIKTDPVIMEFHRPAYSISRFLFDEGEMPEPLFDSCPGTKTEWAFDYTGNIYSCTATVGKEGEEIGTFYPERHIIDEIVEEWEERDVTSIAQCRDCNLALACGGGCAAVAKNKTGEIQSPDCRPVDKLMSLGLGLYFKDIIEGE
jgi:uncharacterized protein